MKTRILYSPRTPLILVVAVASGALTFGIPAFGQDHTASDALLQRVAALNQGLTTYVADVDSTETRGGVTDPTRAAVRSRFRVYWASPGRWLATGVDPQGVKGRKPLQTVDPMQAITKRRMRSVGQIGHGTLRGREVRITTLESARPASGVVFRATMWIDAAESTVVQVRTFWNYTEIATTTFQYERVAGRFLLPSIVETRFPRDELTVVNRYAYRDVNAPIPPEIEERMR